MAFTFPVDSNAKSGAVKSVASGNAFVLPVQLQLGSDGITPIDATNPLDVSAALKAGTAIIGKTGIDQSTPGTTNGVQVNAALPAGTNIIGKTGIDQSTPGTTNGVQVNAALPAGTNNIGDIDIVSAVGSAIVTMHNAAAADGNGTYLSVDGYGTAILEVTGTFVASVAVKGSLDGTNFNSSLSVVKLDTGAKSTTITAAGTYKVIGVAGLTKIQAQLDWTSGTSITVKGRATPLASNDNTIELSGSNTILLKSILSNNSLIGNTTLRIGNTVTNDTSVVALDVSKYPNRSIIITNNYDQAIKLSSVTLQIGSTYGAAGTTVASNISIAAGATLSVDKSTYSAINAAGLYLYLALVQSTTPPTTGSVTVYIVGGAC